MTDSVPRPRKSQRSRQAILDAATTLFAERGYDGTTLREIGAVAGIDPAMVVRYFGDKAGLFAQAARFEIGRADLEGVPRERLGAALLGHFLAIWESAPAGTGFVALLRSAAVNEVAARRMQEIFANQVAPQIAAALGRRDAGRVAGLVATQMLGLSLCRYVLALPPVAEMSPEEVIEAVGPAIQGYLDRASA